jgi:hypothetical protein
MVHLIQICKVAKQFFGFLVVRTGGIDSVGEQTQVHCLAIDCDA